MAETTTKKKAPAAKGEAGAKCSVEGCKRAYRAKSFCFFHFKKWRQGDLAHPRYHTCSHEACRKRATQHGLCAEHYATKHGKAAPAAAKPAAQAAPAAPAA